ncbi:MAG TPA: outer membrane protein assembly factor BamA, partial [Cytophagaceae bacterium]
PQEYIIGGITVSGIQYLDPQALIAITDLKVGDKITIPGDELSNAIKKLYEQGLVGDAEITITKVEGNKIYLDFYLRERPRLSKIIFTGVKKSEEEDLQNKIELSRGKIVNDALIKNAQKKIKDYFNEKGFFNTEVKVTQIKDTLLPNSVILKFAVNKKDKVRINEIIFHGNQALSEKQLEKRMKKTKEKSFYKIFTSSKFIKTEYEQDLSNIIDYYNSKGYRDAKILSDTIYAVEDDRINIEITIDEGNRYYFREITWKGNYIYDDKFLSKILDIKKGDVYNMQTLQSRLNFNPNGLDISSLYLDDGYLFFNVEPVETLVEGDSIDIEIRIYEGQQATINEVIVSGNTKTHDHVILRELRTVPGEKFSRSDLIRSQRELAQLGYFDPEQIGISPIPDPATGTVDIHYTVVEKPSDQIELSGGWGGVQGLRFVGTLGLVFNNFSLRNVPEFKTWSPLPSGDGQRLALRFQANGRVFQTYSLSFTEPWLGGRRPNSFTFSLTRSNQNIFRSGDINKRTGHLTVQGATISLGRRLKWPDDFFSMSNSLSFMNYDLENYEFGGIQGFNTGHANNINLGTTIARNNLDDFTYPKRGSSIALSVSATPPYSLFRNLDYSDPNLTPQERFKWIEYHKWMFDNSWFTTLAKGQGKTGRSLVLNVRTHFGFIGSYNSKAGIGPFERFILGGGGLSGFNFLLGSEIIGLRGYPDNQIIPIKDGVRQTQGGTIYDKFVAELRYPLSTSPAFSIFILGFAEGGNTWDNFSQFNPFQIKRSAGVGTRIFMPAFGMIGIDWGYGFDKLPGSTQKHGPQVTFTIGQQLR